MVQRCMLKAYHIAKTCPFLVGYYLNKKSAFYLAKTSELYLIVLS
jgi:hypothetical protein